VSINPKKSAIQVSVVISTKNRKEELVRALNSCFTQTLLPEVIVIDDGSTDGTFDCVRENFPNAHLVRHSHSRGYIACRNEGARLAKGRFIFSIDDDAEFTSTETIEETVADFSHDRVGAVAIPYIEPSYSMDIKQLSSDRNKVMIANTFKGTAYAVKRSLFLKLGAFREPLIHQGEESDFCIRMLDAGYFVRLGNSKPITHYESPKRSLDRMDHYGVRNAVLFLWQNSPWFFLIPYLLGTTFRCLSYTFNPRRLFLRLLGLVDGYFQMVRTKREPVTRSNFQLFRKLRNTPVPIGDLVSIKSSTTMPQ
jgi:GT2 family glycosyltransferase